MRKSNKKFESICVVKELGS